MNIKISIRVVNSADNHMFYIISWSGLNADADAKWQVCEAEVQRVIIVMATSETSHVLPESDPCRRTMEA